MLRSLARFCRSTIRISSVLWICLVAFAQGFSGSPTSTASAKYSISGTVVNAVTGEPIRHALVQTYIGTGRTAFTDGNGQFEFRDLPPGQTSINVRKPGYFDESQVPSLSRVPEMANIGPDARPLVLKLIPEGVIYGRVQGANRKPIENLRVNLFTTRVVDGRRRVEQTQGASTNDIGEFRIAGLLPGVYYLEAGPSWQSSELDPSKRGSHGYSALFYPGSPDLASASPIEITPGQQVNADLELPSAQFFKISGTVIGGDSGINLQIVDHVGNSIPVMHHFDPASGEFQAMAPSGRYTLVAAAYPAGAPWTAEIPLNVTADQSGIQLALSPESSIPVQVRTEATQSLSVEGPAVPSIHLIDTSHLGSRMYSLVVQGNPRNPSLQLQNLSPGKYHVEVSANGPWYVQSAQCGTTDLLRDELTITGGFQSPPVEIVLRDDGASLEVRISNGPSQERMLILLVPDNGSSVHAQTVFSNGTIGLHNLAPGSYSVLAFDHADGLEYTNPEVLSPYMSKAAHVVLQPNQEQQVDVQLASFNE